MNVEALCMGCMNERGEDRVCPHCGYAEGMPASSPLELLPRTVLGEQYVVGRAIGHGGFGILYLAWDLRLERKVAVKEYMPQGIALRTPGQTRVSVHANLDDYKWGLDRFLDEARVVARFHERPDVVSVINFFAQNGTGYMVMEFLDGRTLLQYVERKGGRIPYAAAERILMPVMDALREVHQAGILHRDVSPDNVFLTNTGLVKLLDFGAARQALGQKSQNLSIILKEGYAPEEQYRSKGKQGPWTDVYATAATFYRVVTGAAPPPAPDRSYEDELRPPSSLGVEIPPHSEAALLKALSIRAEDRFQSMGDFQTALLAGGPAPASHPVPPRPDPIPPPPPPPPPPQPTLLEQFLAPFSGRRGAAVAAGGAVLLIALVTVLLLDRDGGGADDGDPVTTAAVDSRIVGVWRNQWSDGMRSQWCHIAYEAQGRYQWLHGCPPALANDHGSIAMAGGEYQAVSQVSGIGDKGKYALLSNDRLQMTRGDGFITYWDRVVERADNREPERERPPDRQTGPPEEDSRPPQRETTPPPRERTPPQQDRTPPQQRETAPPDRDPYQPERSNMLPNRDGAPRTDPYRQQQQQEQQPQAPADYVAFTNEAANLLRRQQRSEAYALLQRAIEANPGYPPANALIASLLLYDRGDPVAAARHYQTAYDQGETITFFIKHDVHDGTFVRAQPGVLTISKTLVRMTSGRANVFSTSPGGLVEAKRRGRLGGALARAKGVSSPISFKVGATSFNIAPTSSRTREEGDLILKFLSR